MAPPLRVHPNVQRLVPVVSDVNQVIDAWDIAMIFDATTCPRTLFRFRVLQSGFRHIDEIAKFL
eukprot:4294774-Pyramimonas_sp.AAC.1